MGPRELRLCPSLCFLSSCSVASVTALHPPCTHAHTFLLRPLPRLFLALGISLRPCSPSSQARPLWVLAPVAVALSTLPLRLLSPTECAGAPSPQTCTAVYGLWDTVCSLPPHGVSGHLTCTFSVQIACHLPGTHLIFCGVPLIAS